MASRRHCSALWRRLVGSRKRTARYAIAGRAAVGRLKDRPFSSCWYINPDWWRSRGAQLIAGGIAFLAVSLLIKHTGTDVTLFDLAYDVAPVDVLVHHLRRARRLDRRGFGDHRQSGSGCVSGKSLYARMDSLKLILLVSGVLTIAPGFASRG